jgi:hypothetical protein
VGTNKNKGFLGNSWACESENRLQIVHTNRPKLKQTTDKYSAVFTEYSVAEYSADHYSAEYSADRIVGRSLVVEQSTADR